MKELLITKCSHPLAWYSGKVGERVPYLGKKYGDYKSREDAGWVNYVKMEDAIIVNKE